MQQHRKDANHTIAFIITVAVVVFLEMVEVGVADREQVRQLQTPRYFRFDRARTGQTRRRMNAEIAVRSRENRLEPPDRLAIVETRNNCLVRSRVKSSLERSLRPRRRAQNAGTTPVYESVFNRVACAKLIGGRIAHQTQRAGVSTEAQSPSAHRRHSTRITGDG